MGTVSQTFSILTRGVSKIISNNSKKHKKPGDEWDHLDKSIVARLADDVIVGVRSKKVEIIIKKKF